MRMSVLVAYATIEGQTAKIARFVEEELTKSGTEVTLTNADELDDVGFDGVDAVVLAAPVHERRHPEGFEAFLVANKSELDARRTLFLSVSLSAAFPDGKEEAQDYVTEMKMRTEFTPDETLLVPGAVRQGAYDYYSMQVLEHVVLGNRDFDPQSGQDHEFTDWDVLRSKVQAFVKA